MRKDTAQSAKLRIYTVFSFLRMRGTSSPPSGSLNAPPRRLVKTSRTVLLARSSTWENILVVIEVHSEVHPVPTARRPLNRLSGVQPPPRFFNPPPISSFGFCRLINAFCGTRTALLWDCSYAALLALRRTKIPSGRRGRRPPCCRVVCLSSG